MKVMLWEGRVEVEEGMYVWRGELWCTVQLLPRGPLDWGCSKRDCGVIDLFILTIIISALSTSNDSDTLKGVASIERQLGINLSLKDR